MALLPLGYPGETRLLFEEGPNGLLGHFPVPHFVWQNMIRVVHHHSYQLIEPLVRTKDHLGAKVLVHWVIHAREYECNRGAWIGAVREGLWAILR